ncbi:MAG: slipin family protein [Gemmatimonadetes bacterium]|nr:slipin family protein [Gemmatimonadota bacterium]
MLGLTRIKAYEKGLLFHYGDFVRLVQPGKYRLWSRMWSRTRDRLNVVSTLETKFEHPLLDVLIKNRELAGALTIVELADHERALVWKDGRLAYILGTGRHAFWNEPYRLEVEVFDTNSLRFEHPKLEAIVSFGGSSRWLTGVDVADYEDTLLIKDGEIVETLRKGRHVFWANVGRVSWKTIDRREQVADVAGQEIMTKDKVTLRVNLLVAYEVIDSIKAVTVVSDHAQTLYRESQLVLRASVGTRTLDALLADKESVGGEVKNALAARAREFGVAVKSVGLKDIILPGEMKTILNQVIEAEKSAQANLIKRREETAAARSQANTAKLLAENPTLARMKELEQLSEILSGTRSTFVFGSGDLSDQIRTLVGSTPPKDA